jgi:hypothetical protein
MRRAAQALILLGIILAVAGCGRAAVQSDSQALPSCTLPSSSRARSMGSALRLARDFERRRTSRRRSGFQSTASFRYSSVSTARYAPFDHRQTNARSSPPFSKHREKSWSLPRAWSCSQTACPRSTMRFSYRARSASRCPHAGWTPAHAPERGLAQKPSSSSSKFANRITGSTDVAPVSTVDMEACAGRVLLIFMRVSMRVQRPYGPSSTRPASERSLRRRRHGSPIARRRAPCSRVPFSEARPRRSSSDRARPR